MRVLFIQHDHVSPTGPVGEQFAERGYDVLEHLVVPRESHDTPGVEPALPDLTRYDAVVPMGAKWSAYDHHLIGSWVRPEIEALRAADAAEVPVLGICFGGQLLALAHGGEVERAPEPEIGWREIVGDDAPLSLAGTWFQWHYDRWTVPPEARELARNERASQAFVMRRNLAVQFHPELTSTMLGGWLGADPGAGEQQERVTGLGTDELLETTREREAEAAQRARRLVDDFLTHVARA